MTKILKEDFKTLISNSAQSNKGKEKEEIVVMGKCQKMC